MGKLRIETLADGVFAIAMTLLVLELILPKPLPGEKSLLLSQLLPLWPKFASFVLSFLICGVFWVGHVAMTHYVKQSNRFMLWITIAYLMTVSAVPFSTALLGDYHPEPLAIAIYCGNLFLASSLQYLQLRYIIDTPEIRVDQIPLLLSRTARKRMLVGPVLYLAAMLVCWVTPSIAMLLCALTLLFYILPGRVDRYLREGT